MTQTVTRREACDLFCMSESTWKLLRQHNPDTFPIAIGVRINAPVYPLDALKAFIEKTAPKFARKAEEKAAARKAQKDLEELTAFFTERNAKAAA